MSENNQKKSASPRMVGTGNSGEKGHDRAVNATKLACLIALLKILVKGKKHYCQPRPNTLIELLEKYHKIYIQRRWFFQCMRDLEDQGLICRKRRWIHTDDNTVYSESSLWFFTIRGAQFLKSKAISGAADLLKRMLEWLHRDDSRQPDMKTLAPREPEIDRAEGIRRVQALLEAVFKHPSKKLSLT